MYFNALLYKLVDMNDNQMFIFVLIYNYDCHIKKSAFLITMSIG